MDTTILLYALFCIVMQDEPLIYFIQTTIIKYETFVRIAFTYTYEIKLH